MIAMEQVQASTVSLNDGAVMPMIAYGTGSSRMKAGEVRAGLSRELVRTFKLALAAGYRHIDTAEVYGTEAELGVALAEIGLPRSELFIAGKVFEPSGDIRASLAESLALLQLDHLDLFMIHQPFTSESEAVLQDAWAVMESLQAEGKARSIGVSNFGQAQIESLLSKATVPPAVNQTEYHPYLQRGALKRFLDSKGIRLEAYSPLTPLIDGQGRPGPLDDKLAALSKKYGVGEAEVLLSWHLQQGVVPVITSGKYAHMKAALKSGQLRLAPEDMREITETGSKKNLRRWWGNFYPDGDFS